jgi:uncharacterized protein (DUF58 family)
MTAPNEDTDPVEIALLPSLELVARTLVRGLLQGQHFGRDAGSSAEFLAYRAYSQGDEIRRVDWRTFARTDRFYVKDYQQETNLRATLVVDVSGSMAYKSTQVSKYRYACCIAAALGYLLMRQQDSVALALVDSSLRRFVPPKGTPQHLSVLLRLLESTRPDNETGLAQALRTVGRRADARSLIIVLSDFLDDPREVIASLSRLAQRGADVIACHVLDPAERSFPFDNWTRFRDSEDATVDLRVDARQLKQVYRENLERHLRILEDGCRGAAIDYLPFSTDMPFRRSLAAYLEARSRRRR